MADDTGPVQPGDELDWPALSRYLQARLPRVEGFARRYGAGPLPALAPQRVPGGYSNLTYLVRFGPVELVLRRPPLGPLPPRAHDMAREYRWLAALHPVFALAPEPFLLCEDENVVGSVFYVMERRHGIVVRGDEPPMLRERPSMRRRVGESLVDALVDLHAVDVSRPPLASLGKPEGFVARQVAGWTDRWHRAASTPLPEMEALAVWLRTHLPPTAPPAVVHGDFKLDNVVLDPDDLSRIVAVLDWEMCALGDPLLDVGMLLVYWVHAAASGARDSWAAVTGQPGWLGREELLDRYAHGSRRDVTGIRFYELLGLFKLAVILQQLYGRHLRGQRDDERLADLGARVTGLARYGAGLLT